MENASKALIIAGSVLIAIMIISLGMVIFNNFAENAKEGANLDEQEIGEFNSQITPYIGESVTGSQVNTLIQNVISNNIAVVSGEIDGYKAITITFPGNEASGIYVNKNNNPWSLEYGTGVKKVATGASAYYKVTPEYGENGLINTITITK